MIPPVPSDLGSQYHFFPVGAVSVVVFGLGRFLAVFGKKTDVALAIFETTVFVIFGIVLFDRVQMCM